MTEKTVRGLRVPDSDRIKIPVKTSSEKGSNAESGDVLGNKTHNSIEMKIGDKYVSSLGLTLAPRQTGTFTCKPGFLYPVDTGANIVMCIIPADFPLEGRVGFFDASGTWDTNLFKLRSTLKVKGDITDKEFKSKYSSETLLYLDITRGLVPISSASAPSEDGGEGGGSGFGIPIGKTVVNNSVLSSEQPNLIDQSSTLTLDGCSISRFNGNYLAGRKNVAITAGYMASDAGNTGTDWPVWEKNGIYIAMHPVLKKWFMFVPGDPNGTNGWYIQLDDITPDSPLGVKNWGVAHGKPLGKYNLDANVRWVHAQRTFLLPPNPVAGDNVYLCDLWRDSEYFPFILGCNGNAIDGIEEDILVDVNGAAGEWTFINGYGWKLVRGMGVSTSVAGGNQSDELKLKLVSFYAPHVIEAASSITPDLTDGNVQHIPLVRDTIIKNPDKGDIATGTWYFKIYQDAKGGRKVTFDTNYHVHHQGVVGGMPNEITIATVACMGDDHYEVWLSSRF